MGDYMGSVVGIDCCMHVAREGRPNSSKRFESSSFRYSNLSNVVGAKRKGSMGLVRQHSVVVHNASHTAYRNTQIHHQKDYLLCQRPFNHMHRFQFQHSGIHIGQSGSNSTPRASKERRKRKFFNSSTHDPCSILPCGVGRGAILLCSKEMQGRVFILSCLPHKLQEVTVSIN